MTILNNIKERVAELSPESTYVTHADGDRFVARLCGIKVAEQTFNGKDYVAAIFMFNEGDGNFLQTSSLRLFNGDFPEKATIREFLKATKCTSYDAMVDWVNDHMGTLMTIEVKVTEKGDKKYTSVSHIRGGAPKGTPDIPYEEPAEFLRKFFGQEIPAENFEWEPAPKPAKAPAKAPKTTAAESPALVDDDDSLPFN